MPLDLAISQRLKALGFPQDFDLDPMRPCMWWIDKHPRHVVRVIGGFIEDCYGHRYDVLDDKCRAPEALDVLESEWLTDKGWRWERQRSGLWVAYPPSWAATAVEPTATSGPELIRAILDKLGAA